MEKLTREELFDLVWTTPMSKLAARFGVSDVALAKVCVKLDIPRPSRGYWQQRAVGDDGERPLLPDAEPGAELEWVRDGSEPRRQPMLARSPRRATDRSEKHPLLFGARGHFDHARPRYDTDRNHYVRPWTHNLVDVFVSPDTLGRALKVANALFQALEDRGQQVVLAPKGRSYHRAPPAFKQGQERKRDDDYYDREAGRWTPDRPTVTLVGDVPIGLTLFEISEEVEARYDATVKKLVRVSANQARRTGLFGSPQSTYKHWLPSGRLGLHAYAPLHGVEWEHYWFESRSGGLPSLFEEIAAHLQRDAPRIAELTVEAERRREEERRKWEAQQEEWRKQEVKERRERKAEQRREVQAHKEADFGESIAGWRLARDVREYVAAVRALVDVSRVEIMPGGGLARSARA